MSRRIGRFSTLYTIDLWDRTIRVLVYLDRVAHALDSLLILHRVLMLLSLTLF